MSDKGFGFDTIVHLMCDDEETYRFRRLIVLLYFCKLVILFQAVLDVVALKVNSRLVKTQKDKEMRKPAT